MNNLGSETGLCLVLLFYASLTIKIGTNPELNLLLLGDSRMGDISSQKSQTFVRAQKVGDISN